MKVNPLLKLLLLTLAAMGLRASAAAEVPPAAALAQLAEGNARFVANSSVHPRGTGTRREETAAVQRPFAIILGCADSRTGPELIFDQGLGDLFVVRLAGNIADEAVLGSIEFAVAQLGAQLIVVLGHERCGAVAAAVQGGGAPGHIGALVAAIQPAVKTASGEPGDLLENAIRENVLAQVQKLKTASPILQPMLQAGSLQVAGARYDLKTGRVTFYQ